MEILFSSALGVAETKREMGDNFFSFFSCTVKKINYRSKMQIDHVEVGPKPRADTSRNTVFYNDDNSERLRLTGPREFESNLKNSN